MAGSTNKDMSVLMKQAEDQGWVITPTSKGHYKWLSPMGKFIFSSSTPSDGNAVHQIRRDLVKLGFIIVAHKKKGKR